MREVIWIPLLLAILSMGCGVAEATPTPEAIAALKGLSDLHVLDFYESLKSLYLSGGFNKGNQFNGAVLLQGVIPQVIWNQMRYVVNQTRGEIKNGDFSMKRIDAMSKLYNVDTLIHEPWLSRLAEEIAKNSEYPKNLAFAIRDLGVNLTTSRTQNYTRTSYVNGTFLRAHIKSWLNDQNLMYGVDLPALLCRCHHTIGPENFGLLGDVLEVLPYQVKGMYPSDTDALYYYTENIDDQILDADIGDSMTKLFKNAFKNLTGEWVEENDFLYQLSKADLEKGSTALTVRTISSFSTSRGGPPAKPVLNRSTKSTKELIRVISNQLGVVDKLKLFGTLAANHIEVGAESLENIRMAMIAGARLVHNLGSIEDAIRIAQLVPLAVKTDTDIKWRRRVNGALKIIKYLSIESENGNGTGGEIMLKAFLNEPRLYNQPVFLNTKAADFIKMLILFRKVRDVNQVVLGQVAKTVSSWPLEKLSSELSNISGSNRLTKIKETFGGADVRNNEDAQKVQDFLSSLHDATTASNFTDMCSSFMTISANVTNYSSFTQALVDFVPLSRDRQWQDVWNAFYAGSSALFTASNNYQAVLNPMINIVNLKQKKSLVNMREVLYSLQQLSDGCDEVVEAKVNFLKDFYGELTTDTVEVEEILEGFNVNSAEIAEKVTATMYVDDFLDVLKSSGSYPGLKRLLGFHNSFTTNQTDPDASWQLITGMITHLHQTMGVKTTNA